MMQNSQKEKLLSLTHQFIEKTDFSLNAAKQIESLLLDYNSEGGIAEDLIDMLASYSPGGGEYLFDEDQIIPKLSVLREELIADG